MFFQTFWTWLTARLAAYISSNTAQVAAAIEPVAAVMAVVYVMIWGYLHLRGRIEEPIMEAAMRVLKLVVVFGAGLHLWLYHAVVTELFFNGPDELVASLVGATTPVATIDTIWASGAQVAATLWDKGSVLAGDIGFYIAGVAVYLLIGFCCVYTLFLLSLAKIAVSVLLAIGPIFLVLTLLESTRRYFAAWIQELANYALVSVVTVMVSALMLDLVKAYADQTAARGEALVTVDALNLALAACGLSALSVTAIVVMAPLKRVEPFLVRVDASTGVADVIPNYVGTADLPDSVLRHLATEYVSVRERYVPALAETDYEQVGAYHSAAMNQKWAALWARGNPASPLNLYADGTHVSSRIRSVSFLRHDHVNPDVLQVRLTRGIAHGDVADERAEHLVVTLTTTFAAPSADARTRALNPLGFKVLEYVAEPELPDPGPTSAGCAAVGGAP